MQDIELRFPSLKDLMYFKQSSEVTELRIDTNAKSLTGRFPEKEIKTAMAEFKAVMFSN